MARTTRRVTRASASLRRLLEPQPPAGKLTQMELSERLGVSRQRVSQWCNGESMPSAEMMAAIEDVMGVPMREWAELVDADQKKGAA